MRAVEVLGVTCHGLLAPVTVVQGPVAFGADTNVPVYVMVSLPPV